MHWRSPTFWFLLIVGWLVTALVLNVFARYFSSFDDMPPRELWTIGVTIHVLSVLAGFAFARKRFDQGMS